MLGDGAECKPSWLINAGFDSASSQRCLILKPKSDIKRNGGRLASVGIRHSTRLPNGQQIPLVIQSWGMLDFFSSDSKKQHPGTSKDASPAHHPQETAQDPRDQALPLPGEPGGMVWGHHKAPWGPPASVEDTSSLPSSQILCLAQPTQPT